MWISHDHSQDQRYPPVRNDAGYEDFIKHSVIFKGPRSNKKKFLKAKVMHRPIPKKPYMYREISFQAREEFLSSD